MIKLTILSLVLIFYALYGLSHEGSIVDRFFKKTIEKRLKNGKE